MFDYIIRLSVVIVDIIIIIVIMLSHYVRYDNDICAPPV